VTDDGLRPRRWVRAARWTAIAAIVGLVAWLAGTGGPLLRQALAVMATVDPAAVLAIVGLEVGWAVALAQTGRHAVLALGGRLGLGQALRISMAGFTVSRVVPGGGAAGGVFALHELRRVGNALPLATMATVTSWAASSAGLGLLVAGALAVTTAAGRPPPAASAPATIGLLALSAAGVLVLVVVRHPRACRAAVALVERLRQRLPRRWRPRGGVPPHPAVCDPRALRRSVVWAAGAWIVDIAALWTALAACGAPVAPHVLLVGYVVATVLNSAPEVTPGWIGVFEAAQAATLAALGVAAPTAVAGVLLYRLLSFWLPTAAGIAPAVVSLRAARSAAGTPVPTARRVAA